MILGNRAQILAAGGKSKVKTMSKKLDTKLLDMPRTEYRPHQVGKIARPTCFR
jgi:hypothetical protein